MFFLRPALIMVDHQQQQQQVPYQRAEKTGCQFLQTVCWGWGWTELGKPLLEIGDY